MGGTATCDCHGASQGVLPGSRDELVRQVIGAFEAAARTPGVTAGAASESRRDPCNSPEVARIRAALDRLQADAARLRTNWDRPRIDFDAGPSPASVVAAITAVMILGPL